MASVYVYVYLSNFTALLSFCCNTQSDLSSVCEPQLQQDVWREVLEFASAALPSSAEPELLAASSPANANVKALLGLQFPVGVRQKLHLLQQFQAWQREQAVLKPLALPRLPIKVGLSVDSFIRCAWQRTDAAAGQRQLPLMLLDNAATRNLNKHRLDLLLCCKRSQFAWIIQACSWCFNFNLNTLRFSYLYHVSCTARHGHHFVMACLVANCLPALQHHAASVSPCTKSLVM